MSDNDNPQVRFGAFQFEARARAIRLFVWIAAMAMPIYIAYELAPFLNREATTARVLSSTAYKDAEKQAIGSISERGQKKISYFEYPVSELASVSVEIGAVGEDKGPVVSPLKTQINLRTDRVILWVGTFAVLMAVLATLVPSLTRLRLGPLHIQLPQSFNRAESAEAEEPTATTTTLRPVDLFAAEVQAAARRADGFFARSTLLLAGGIVMAFIGVGIFYVTLPETQRDETLMSYWPKVVRPTGVLIFVEAIAWFLLRQYRALVEDYKWFYRLYLKRANYLAALRILGTGAVRPEDVFVAASLIQEDLSGRLKSGETTESLEALRLPEESPVTEILRLLTTAKDKAKVEKPQPASEKSGT
jgi:hypothetical protein